MSGYDTSRGRAKELGGQAALRKNIDLKASYRTKVNSILYPHANTGQRKGSENPEIDHHSYRKLTLNQRAKTSQWERTIF